MNVILMTGSHPRHLYIAKQLYDNNMLTGLVIEKREEISPLPDAGLLDLDRENFIRHFRERKNAEDANFGRIDESYFINIPILHVSHEELNSEITKKWLASLKGQIVLTYGIHKLYNQMLNDLPNYAWNIHGGLSPWFRGNATLFWPFYFLKPNWAGMTIHNLTSKIDGGDIIHHSVPMLEPGDGIHDVACKAVKQVAKDIIMLLQILHEGGTIQTTPQKSSGKLFTSADWLPQHLRLIYNTFDNDIVDRYLNGDLGYTEPPLIKAF